MKVPLSTIPDQGWREKLELDVSAMKRLAETHGEQTGKLTAEIGLLLRGGNVELTGNVSGGLKLDCQRCADPVEYRLDEQLAITLSPERLVNEGAEDHRLSPGELNVVYFPGEEIDLVQVLEDEILILLPETVCEEDQDGACVCCGRAVQEVLGGPDKPDDFHPFANMKDFLKDK